MRFNFCLTHANLSSQFRDINIGYYVTQILDAVCNAYHEEDCLLLQTFCDFLKDLSIESRYREELEKSITLEFIQQIFLVLDFSQGNCLTLKLFQQMLNSSYSILNLKYICILFSNRQQSCQWINVSVCKRSNASLCRKHSFLIWGKAAFRVSRKQVKMLIKLDSKSSYLLILL